jgi:hypothetical protein
MTKPDENLHETESTQQQKNMGIIFGVRLISFREANFFS